MIRAFIAFLSLASVIFFPWPFTVFLALASALAEPLIPLAVGLCADVFYYSPAAQSVPLFTLGGAALTSVAFFVRSRLRASIIGG